MAKFAKFHQDGAEVLFNLDHVLAIGKGKEGNTAIVFSLEHMETVDEDYEQARQMAATAQGGLPMDHSRMY